MHENAPSNMSSKTDKELRTIILKGVAANIIVSAALAVVTYGAVVCVEKILVKAFARN